MQGSVQLIHWHSPYSYTFWRRYPTMPEIWIDQKDVLKLERGKVPLLLEAKIAAECGVKDKMPWCDHQWRPIPESPLPQEKPTRWYTPYRETWRRRLRSFARKFILLFLPWPRMYARSIFAPHTSGKMMTLNKMECLAASFHQQLVEYTLRWSRYVSHDLLIYSNGPYVYITWGTS